MFAESLAKAVIDAMEYYKNNENLDIIKFVVDDINICIWGINYTENYIEIRLWESSVYNFRESKIGFKFDKYAEYIDEYILQSLISLKLYNSDVRPVFNRFEIKNDIFSFNKFLQSTRTKIKISPEKFKLIIRYLTQNLTAFDVLLYFAENKRILKILNEYHKLYYTKVGETLHFVSVNCNYITFDEHKLKLLIQQHRDLYNRHRAIICYPDKFEIVTINRWSHLCRLKFDVDIDVNSDNKIDVTELISQVLTKIRKIEKPIRSNIGRLSTALEDFNNLWNMLYVESKI